MKISIIAAVSDNGAIGHEGGLPWRIPNDLERFKKITSGHHIIMGRKTFESIGKPLPNRTNIVLSKDKSYSPLGVETSTSLSEALAIARKDGEREVMIIGGASVYKEALEVADKIYLTKVHGNFDGDTYFPKFDKNKWKETFRESFSKDELNKFDYDFLIYAKGN